MYTLSLLSRYSCHRTCAQAAAPALDEDSLLQRASLQSSKLELYGQTQPLLLEVTVREIVHMAVLLMQCLTDFFAPLGSCKGSCF